MILDGGILTIFEKVNTNPAGLMPVEKLRQVQQMYYGIRTIGFARQYSAMSAGQSVDMLVRVQFNPLIFAGMYVVLEGGVQYRVDLVQHVDNDDGLKMTDLTLARLNDFFDLQQI